jgi:hypothetical protein
LVGAVCFIAGVSITGVVWYIKDYGLDSLYLKGYSKGYEKGYKEATEDSLKVYESVWDKIKEEGEQ